MKIEKDKSYIITDGNGGFLEAKILDKTKAPARIVYVTRGIRPGAKKGRGTFTRFPREVTIPGFRKLLVEQPESTPAP